MCGIAGYYGKAKVQEEKFNQMVDIIDYRGPDDRGVFYEGNLALGHRRLSILDLSPAGHQPFSYKDKYVIVYNGEIYNFKEIRAELVERGYSFVSSCDTEVLIAAYDCYGRECVQKLNGMWAFSIYDRDKKELFLSRDRFGIKPLYYYSDGEKFLFGSEIKQILLMLDKGQKVNKKRLFEYLIRGYSDYTEETMIQGIYQLRGGNNLVLRLDGYDDFGEVDLDSDGQEFIYKVEQYYDLQSKALRNGELNKDGFCGYEEAKESFREAFDESVKLRLRSDVPIGYCLSGGLDSSAIVCTADKIVKNNNLDVKQTSISSCFDDKRYDEQEYIDEVLANTDVNGVKIFPEGDDLLGELDQVIWHMDEPFSSTSQYAQWNVFKGAKANGLTVMLDGQGSDEHLAGYTGFYSVIFAEYLRKFRFGKFANELNRYKELRAETEKYVKPYKIIVEAIISAYLPKFIQKLGKLYLFYLRRETPFERQDIKNTIMGLDLYPANNFKRYIFDNIRCNLAMLLRYEDRNSMAFSIESRVPFLDYKLVENSLRMPIDYKINEGITKRVLRDAIDVMPEKIRNRFSKLGFVTPEDQWINEHPETYRNELIEACKYLSPLLNVDKVLKWYDSVSGNVQRMDYTAFRIICAGRWMKIFELKA